MITVDSSAAIALVDRRQRRHSEAVAALSRERFRLLPAVALTEISYFIERHQGQHRLAIFLRDLIDGAYEIDSGTSDLPRILELVERYVDLPLGFVDAALIACAEWNGGRVLTYDYPHFGVVAGEGTIMLVQ